MRKRPVKYQDLIDVLKQMKQKSHKTMLCSGDEQRSQVYSLVDSNMCVRNQAEV